VIIKVEVKKYKAHPYQQPFHNSPSRFRLMVAGIQSGKTVAGVNEAIRYMIKEAPGTTGMIVSPTYPLLEQQTLPELFRWLPPRKVEGQVVWNYLKTERKLELANGSICFFRHADDPDSLRGPKLSWFYGDEVALFPAEAWHILEGRTSISQGKGWGTTTPKGHNWLFDLYQKWLIKDPDFQDYDFFTFRSIDSPYFKKSEIERAKKVYSEAYFRQEYEASFESFVGRVYPQFSVNTHVIDPFEIPESWEIYESIDTGIAAPTAVGWFAVDPATGRVFMFDEHYVEGETVAWHARKILEKRGNRTPALTIMDPSSFSRTPIEGQSLAEEYARCGIYAIPGDHALDAGIERIWQYLSPPPHFYVFSRCVNTINEFLTYEWGRYSAVGQDRIKPRKKGDHCLDLIRYFLLTRPEAKPKAEPEPTIYEKIMRQLKEKHQEPDEHLGILW